MFTEFSRPSERTCKLITEVTFVIEKKVTERASLFVEYVSEFPANGSPGQLLNSGGLYRLSPNSTGGLSPGRGPQPQRAPSERAQ
jgi:hypothetical protein